MQSKENADAGGNWPAPVISDQEPGMLSLRAGAPAHHPVSCGVVRGRG